MSLKDKDSTKPNIKIIDKDNDLFFQRDTTKKILVMLNNLKKFKIFYKKLNKAQKDVLYYYKGIGYININSYLYNNYKIKDFYINNKFIEDIKPYFSDNTRSLIDLKSINPSNIKKLLELYINKNTVDKINLIDEIFTEPNIPKLSGNEILFRGTRDHTLTTDKSKVGDIIVSKNYMSTSTEQNISESFTPLWNKKKNKKHICCMYILHGLKDVPYIYIPWNIKKAHNYEKMYIEQYSYDEFEYLLPRSLKFKIIKIENRIIKPTFASIKRLSFNKLDKFIARTRKTLHIPRTRKTLHNPKSTKKINNNNIRRIFDKINKRIKTYHIEYIGQEPLAKISDYIYNPSVNIHISPILEDGASPKSKKQKILFNDNS